MIGIISSFRKVKAIQIVAVFIFMILRIQQVSPGRHSRRVIGYVIEFRIDITAIFYVVWQGNGDLQLLKELGHVDVVLIGVQPYLPQGKGLACRRGHARLHANA